MSDLFKEIIGKLIYNNISFTIRLNKLPFDGDFYTLLDGSTIPKWTLKDVTNNCKEVLLFYFTPNVVSKKFSTAESCLEYIFATL